MKWLGKAEKDEFSKKSVDSHSEHWSLEDWGMVP